jgi:acyl-CoA thioester hydrolase
MSEPPANPILVPREAGFDLSPYDVPHPQPFLLDLTVDGDQLSNVIDHVSNVEYVRWLDRAAELHTDAVGYTRRWLLEHGQMWFVARHEIDYLAEAHLGDRLVVATWVRDMKRIRSWRDYIIIRPGDETIVCRAATLWVLVGLETRRPARIPAEMARRFAPLHNPLGALHPAPVERGDPSCTSR